MNEKTKTYRFDYKPGRTPEQLEEERFLEAMQRTPTERFMILMRLIKISKILRAAKIKHQL